MYFVASDHMMLFFSTIIILKKLNKHEDKLKNKVEENSASFAQCGPGTKQSYNLQQKKIKKHGLRLESSSNGKNILNTSQFSLSNLIKILISIL